MVDGPDNSLSGPFANGAAFDFAVGVSQVEYTVVDEAGNETRCIQLVEVTDDEVPMIECAALDAVYNTDLGSCDYTVQGDEFDPTVVSDNCAVESVSNDYNATSSLANAVFPVGSTDVIWTVTDASGNTATCLITVVVEDNENPVFVNCPVGPVTIGADSDCSNGVVWSIPVAEDNCEVVSVTQTAGPAYGSPLTPGTYVIEYTATDGATPANTAVCSFTIIVEDDDDPYLVCQPDITVSADGDCTWPSVASLTDPLLVRDNCPDDVLEYEVVFADLTTTTGTGVVPAGTVFQLGENTVMYTLTDGAGAVIECSFTVTVEDNEAPVIPDCSAGGLFTPQAPLVANPGECVATLVGTLPATD
ncbi:MAG TPA: HYR domain-containing protein, partial [Candidatus Paceibacterota bacterium]|nr:HYR domain-containing protein [Candidatus Paceibacterota bacterium]